MWVFFWRRKFLTQLGETHQQMQPFLLYFDIKPERKSVCLFGKESTSQTAQYYTFRSFIH